MKHMQLAYGLPKGIATAIIMLRKQWFAYLKQIPVSWTWILEGNTFVLYLFIIFFDYVQRTSVDLKTENSITLKKARSRSPADTVKDVDYADDLDVHTNTPTHA